MNTLMCTACLVLTSAVAGIFGQGQPFSYEKSRQPIDTDPTFMIQSTQVPDCPLEVHPDTETMFIVRGPLGNPLPRACPPRTYFMQNLCSCVNIPLDNYTNVNTKCNLRPSAMGPGWYQENVFGMWIHRPCGPGSAFNPSTCDCSLAF